MKINNPTIFLIFHPKIQGGGFYLHDLRLSKGTQGFTCYSFKAAFSATLNKQMLSSLATYGRNHPVRLRIVGEVGVGNQNIVVVVH